MNPLFERAKPRHSAVVKETPPAVVPALSLLNRCKNSTDALGVMMGIPDELWPLIAGYAAQRRFLNQDVVRTVVELVGKDKLVSALGKRNALPILSRFFLPEQL